jgi:hypothetical protein
MKNFAYGLRCINAVACFYSAFFLGIAAVFSPSVGAGAATGTITDVSNAISIGQYDSAYSYLQQAYARGLSEDSLYYFWSEIYLRRGALDTALALTIAAQRKNTGTLTEKLLRQRYTIYATLGWVKEAGEILDSLMDLSAAEKKFVPRISIVNWSGLNVRNIIEENPYPFINSGTLRDRIVNPGQDITLKAAWFFPFWKRSVLVPAVSYNFTNGVEQSNLRFDSLNHSFGFSLDAKNLIRSLSLGYSVQRRVSMFGDASTLNAVSLSRLHHGKRWLSYSSLMYIAEVSQESEVSYQSAWLMHYCSRPLSASTDIALMPLVSCFLTGDLTAINRVPVMYIEDPDVRPVTHYTDGSCTQSIPIPPPPLSMQEQRRLLAAYRAAAVPQNFLVCVPESYLCAMPSVSITHKLPHGFSVEGTLKGMAYYYLKEHQWVSLSAPSDTFIAYSNSEGRYYLVEQFANVTNAETYAGPLELKSFAKRRIDYGIGGELALKRRLWRDGTIGVHAYIKKYGSTLSRDLPAEIKDLLYGIGFSFSMSFGRHDLPNAF